MRRGPVALVLVLLLAGCLGGGPSQPDPSASPTPSPTSSATATSTAPAPPSAVQVLDLLLDFEFVGCRALGLQHTRPLEDIQALLPDGFTAAPAPGSPLGTNAGVVLVEMMLCGNLTTPSVAVPAVFIGHESTYIERPIDRVPQAPDAPVQEYLFRMLSGDALLHALWPAAGYDTYNGTAGLDFVEGTAPARPAFGFAGEYNLIATAAELAPLAGARAQSFARYTVVDADGSVLLWTGTYDLPATASGPATLQLPADSAFAPLGGVPDRPVLGGVAQVVDAGNVLSQDLRRVFT